MPIYTTQISSPLGMVLLAGDEKYLRGLWFEGQKYYAQGLPTTVQEVSWNDTPAFDLTTRWLMEYLEGRDPGALPPLAFEGSPFREAVWRLLCQIPYGQTTTYGALAHTLAATRGRAVSAQAVGGAVGHNPISIVVPCHRVVGARGNLTGYAGGLDRKRALLLAEGIDTDAFSVG
jgi:methylated-DNA-[protein]-cysteine S-methyltransferase